MPKKLPKAYERESKRVGECLLHKAAYSRTIWQLRHNYKLPSHIFVCHTCDNPRCIEDSHHFLGTAEDNVKDAVAKGRAGPQVKGRRHGARRIALAKGRKISQIALPMYKAARRRLT